MTDIIDQTTNAILESVQRDAQPKLGATRIGASAIGDDVRAVWLNWRWCLPQNVEPRIRMIWRLGDVIEDELVRLLRRAGLEVHDKQTNGQQFGYSDVGGHYAMRLDGVVRGVPDAPSVWHALEAKSMADKYFKKLIKDGVELGEPKYYAQCQVVMFHAELTRCLFVAYNKNTSEIYVERIKADAQFGAAMVTKARQIAESDAPPASTYKDRSWWQIKMKSDEYQSIYWGDRLPPTANCRNCRFSRPWLEDPNMEAPWYCTRHSARLSAQQQRDGCVDHNWIPELVDAEALEVHDDAVCAVKYRTGDGAELWNVPSNAGATDAPAFSSRELIELSKVGFSKEWVHDDMMRQLRKDFGAKLESIDTDEAPF